jgi:hypothetical protein
MPVDQTTALRKAATIIADEAKRIAGLFSKRIPATVNVRVSNANSKATIAAGGVEAPSAFFAEKPKNRAPAFGHMKSKWHFTGYHPFLEEAAEAKADEAMQAYADELIPKLIDDSLGRL